MQIFFIIGLFLEIMVSYPLGMHTQMFDVARWKFWLISIAFHTFLCSECIYLYEGIVDINSLYSIFIVLTAVSLVSFNLGYYVEKYLGP